MENKDVKMPPKTRGPMRGPGRGMMPGKKPKTLNGLSANYLRILEITKSALS